MNNNDKFENDLIFFSSENEKNVYREKIYDIVNDKIDLFEKCINQIEVYCKIYKEQRDRIGICSINARRVIFILHLLYCLLILINQRNE